MRDAAGVACSSCPATDPLSVVAIVRNPCADDHDFVTTGTCLASTWSVVDLISGMGTAMGKICGAAITAHTVSAGGTVEDVQSWGRMGASDYELSISFDDAARSSASTLFTVY